VSEFWETYTALAAWLFTAQFAAFVLFMVTLSVVLGGAAFVVCRVVAVAVDFWRGDSVAKGGA